MGRAAGVGGGVGVVDAGLPVGLGGGVRGDVGVREAVAPDEPGEGGEPFAGVADHGVRGEFVGVGGVEVEVGEADAVGGEEGA